MNNQRVLIMAGGTGGHVFPALAIANALRDLGRKVEWLGTERGIEARVVPENGFTLHCIQVKGFRGKGLLAKLAAPLEIVRAVWQAWKVIQQLSPDLVVGFGGFASGPGGLVARLQGRPLVIHEQNAVAGTTNRLLAKLTPHRLTAFPGVLAGEQFVGNPVRSAIVQISPPDARYREPAEPMRLLVLGGSLGAKFINQLMPQLVAELQTTQPPNIVHQCGVQWVHETQQAYAQAGVTATVVPFIEAMANAYAHADLVICRAGAMTVSEVAAAGVASVLIPLPQAIDDHQSRNADWLARHGGAVLIRQSDQTQQELKNFIEVADRNRDLLLRMARQARSQAQPEAVEKITAKCLEVLHGE